VSDPVALLVVVLGFIIAGVVDMYLDCRNNREIEDGLSNVIIEMLEEVNG